MSGYLFTFAGMSVLIALVCIVLPAQAVQHVKLLCGLLTVLLVCAPLLELIAAVQTGELHLPDEWSQPSCPEQNYQEPAQDLLAGQLQLLLERDQDLPPDQCRIYVSWDQEERIEQVTLILSGKAIWRDPDPIAKYVRELLGCPCTVVLDG